MRKRIGALPIAGAFAVAVLAALLLIPVIHCVGLGIGLSTRGTCTGTVGGYLIFGTLIGLPIALVFGVPLCLAFRKFGWLAWWQVPLGAGVAGVLGALALHALDSSTNLLGSVGLFGGLGAFAGVVFWLLTPRGHEP